MTRMADLDQLAKLINSGTQTADFYIQGAYGRVRLVRRGGSIEVSPSLTKAELELWIRAFIAGLDTPKPVDEVEALRRETFESFVDSNRAMYAEHVRGWFDPEVVRTILPSGEWGTLDG